MNTPPPRPRVGLRSWRAGPFLPMLVPDGWVLSDERAQRSHERWFWLWAGTLHLLQRQDPRALDRLWAKLDRHGLLTPEGQLFSEVVEPVPPPAVHEAVRAFGHDHQPVSLRGRRKRLTQPLPEDVGLTPTGYDPRPEGQLATLYQAAYRWCEWQDRLGQWRAKQGRRKLVNRRRGDPSRQERALAMVVRLQRGTRYTEQTIRQYVKIGRRTRSARHWASLRWQDYLTRMGELKT